MSIKDFSQKIKSVGVSAKNTASDLAKIGNDIFIIFLIVLTGMASFGLGKLSALEKQKIPISVLKTKEAMYASVMSGVNNESVITKQVGETNSAANGLVLASKSGTKYYYPSCSGVSRIKEENKVWFSTVEEAVASGLSLAVNCTPE